MQKNTVLVMIFACTFLAACSRTNKYDEGYHDGYESGYEDGKSEFDYSDIDYDELDTNFLIEELQIRDYVIFKNADYESMYSYLQDNEFIENSED